MPCVPISFARKEHLQNHLKDYQTCAFMCDHCNKKFCGIHNLKDHIWKQDSEKLNTVNNEIRSPIDGISYAVWK